MASIMNKDMTIVARLTKLSILTLIVENSTTAKKILTAHCELCIKIVFPNLKETIFRLNERVRFVYSETS